MGILCEVATVTPMQAAEQPVISTQPAPEMPANVPDPLRCEDGTRVTTPEAWLKRRRPELLALFTREMYGQMPPPPAGMKFELFDDDPHALDGLATRRQVAINLTGAPDGPRIDLLLYLPNARKGPAPVIFGLNFWGNHAVIADPKIRLTPSYVESGGALHSYLDLSGVKNNRATDACRGTDAVRWPIREMLQRGYGFATIYRGDIDADLKDRPDLSIKRLFPALQHRGDNFSTIGAWAWGLSRGMDYLVTDAGVDPKRVAVFGWSRLGKAALWAAANDTRFALVLSAESGSGGAKLFHHNVGESIRRLNEVFPHWYCENFRKYNDHETTLPFDQHEVIALIAPRPVYASASEGSQIFDPIGEFLGPKAAEPVYRLLGAGGLPAESTPPLGVSVQGTLGYHRRPGRHDVTPFDWQNYLAFCDRHLQPPPATQPANP